MSALENTQLLTDEVVHNLFETICAEHVGTVRRVARRFVSDASVLDVQQEALMAAYRKLPQLRDPNSVKGWLATLTRRVALKYLSRKGRQLGDMKSGEEEKEGAADLQASSRFAAWQGRIEDISLLRQLCGTLSRDDVTILVGLHIEERSLNDISREVGLSEVNVKVRAHRARNRLLKQLEKGEIV
jgi:RNA polymerase sigma-70 factor (ECF subfamily)